MAKLPSTIVVGPYTYTIEEDALAALAHGLSSGDIPRGLTDISEQTITLTPGMHADLQAVVMLHELLHVCWHNAEIGWSLKEGMNAGEVEEVVIASISAGLLDALRRNPKLVKFLLDKE
jgi:hypothetical protein